MTFLFSYFRNIFTCIQEKTSSINCFKWNIELLIISILVICSWSLRTCRIIYIICLWLDFILVMMLYFVKSVILLKWGRGRGWHNTRWLLSFHVTCKSAVNKGSSLVKRFTCTCIYRQFVSRRRVTSSVYYHDKQLYLRLEIRRTIFFPSHFKNAFMVPIFMQDVLYIWF